jgi:hypothetical protein
MAVHDIDPLAVELPMSDERSLEISMACAIGHDDRMVGSFGVDDSRSSWPVDYRRSAREMDAANLIVRAEMRLLSVGASKTGK